MKQLCVVKCSIYTEVQMPPLKKFLIGLVAWEGGFWLYPPYTLSATTDSPLLPP